MSSDNVKRAQQLIGEVGIQFDAAKRHLKIDPHQAMCFFAFGLEKSVKVMEALIQEYGEDECQK